MMVASTSPCIRTLAKTFLVDSHESAFETQREIAAAELLNAVIIIGVDESLVEELSNLQWLNIS